MIILGDSQEENQGKVLLHNEHSILSILQDTSGVIHHHGLFREHQKIILVLSCLYQHNYDNDGQYQVNCTYGMDGFVHKQYNKVIHKYTHAQTNTHIHTRPHTHTRTHTHTNIEELATLFFVLVCR